MFKHQGIWLPDGEIHFPLWMDRNGEKVDGRGTYQIKKIREVLKHVTHGRTAIDVGAHVGLWTLQLFPHFDFVKAFEPMELFRECFRRNLGDDLTGRVEVFPYALGATHGEVSMRYNPADSGNTHVVPLGAASPAVQMRTLDSFGFRDVGLLKIDCEGFELQVVSGATELLGACRPVIIVEQKPHKLAQNYGTTGTPAVAFLEQLGAHVVREMGGDFIMVWPK